MRYYDSLGVAGYPIVDGLTREQDWQEHLDRGSLGGVDYPVAVGTPVIAPTRGIVVNNTASGPGNYVSFYHLDDAGNKTGFYDQFLHLSRFVSPGTYELGATIGFSGNTGTQTTGPHIHWHAVNAQGVRVKFWEYFTNNPPAQKKVRKMFFNYCKQNGIHYVVGQEFIYGVKGADVNDVKWNMGEPREHATLQDFKDWVVNLGVPAKVVDGISATNRSWSKLDTIAP
jgi:murein DD-endopeptidase MepM/ murein hydrolase activator NlpD